MGRHVIAAVSMSAALLFAASESQAQNQLPRPGQLPPAGGQRQQPQQKPSQQQPAPKQQQSANKPYKAVAVTPPKPIDDPSLEAFRKQVGAIAEKKDRAALAGLVSKSFFWIGEKGDQADKKKSGIDNLSKALGIEGKDAADGWDTLANFASEFTGGEYSERKGTMCSPGQPTFNDDEFGALVKSTGTEDDDWGYIIGSVEMHATAQPDSPVVEKLGAHFVRLMEDEAAENQKVPMNKIVAPSGKTGYVPADAVGSLENDEICYAKEGGAWKIAGYLE